MATLNPSPIRSERWTLVGIILFLTGIVVLPIVNAYWPIERARWLLAAADNALEVSKGDDTARREAMTLLDRAKASFPDIENTLDFARISFRMNPEETDRAIKLVLSMEPSRQVHAANALAEMRLETQDFDAAYEILAAGYPAPSDRTPIEQNQLAYYAALANRDLDAALAGIEKALSDPELRSASFLDTKAWVLFRMGRIEDALAAIDEAIEELEGEVNQIEFPPAVRQKIQDLMEGKEPFVKRPLEDKSDPLSSFNRNFAQVLKSLVVIHYHRAEILEAAGMLEEADQEYSWVQDRGFNDFDRLY